MCCDATITKHKCNAIPTYRSYVLFLIYSWYYRIAGKFGGEINLAVYLCNRQIYQTTKYKSANIFTKVILGLTANISSHTVFYLHYSSGYSFILECYYLSQTKINLLFHRFAGPIFWIPKKTYGHAQVRVPYHKAMTIATWSSKDDWTMSDSQHQAFILYTVNTKWIPLSSIKFFTKSLLYPALSTSRKWATFLSIAL